MSASVELFTSVNKNSCRVKISTVLCITFYFITPASTLIINVNPGNMLDIWENACLAVVTEFASSDTIDIFHRLEKFAFKHEDSVLFGSVKIQTFVWPSGEELKLNNGDNQPDILLFQRKKIDRTCLLKAANVQQHPVPIPYKGALNVETMTGFVNDKCDTYRDSIGNINFEGLHRQEVLQNLFTVSSISNITSKIAVTSTRIDILSTKDTYDKDLICGKDNVTCIKNENESKKQIYSNKNDLDDYDKRKFDYTLPECEKIDMPTSNQFFHNYLKISKPVIIKNAISEWPAFTKWTNEFLKEKYGEKDVHIKLTPGGEYEGVEPASLWENYLNFKIPQEVKKKLSFPDLVVVRPATMNLKFSEFVKLIETVSNKVFQNVSAYLEYSSIPDYLPELEDDISEMPFFEGILKRQHLNIWLSDGNTLGKLHFDAFDNFLCQISGRKQVILFEPHDNSKLYESHIPEAMLSYNRHSGQFRRKTLVDSTSMVMSPVDIRNIDFKRFPEFSETFPLNCTIDEGDVLFMPSFWWHEVQSYPNITAGRNLAVNFWYEPFLTKEFPCPECKLDINPKYRHLLL